MTSQQALQDDWQLQQAMDEANEFYRRVELVELAKQSPRFTAEDISDLQYFLAVSDYFKEPK